MKVFNKSTLPILVLFTLLSSAAMAAMPIIPMPPALAAKAWILMDANTNHIIVEHEADKRLPPASLTKIMTAYVAADALKRGTVNMSDKVRISVKAWKTGGSRMFIREGTYVSFEDLLRGMIVDSGNDASVAIAQHVAGSTDAFVDLMNQHALRLGMMDTHYMNVDGLPHKDHYATPHDLAKLTIALINNFPDFYKIFSEKYFTYNDIRQANRNELLWRDPSVDGVKTGHTESAGYCLVASAKRHDMRLVSVVMGTKSEDARATESQKLLTYGFRYYTTVHLYTAGDSLKKVRVWKGQQEAVGVGLPEDAVLTIPRGARKELKGSMQLDDVVEAPVKVGEKLGQLTITMDGKQVYQSPLLAIAPVPRGGLMSRMWDAIDLFFVQLFGGDTSSPG